MFQNSLKLRVLTGPSKGTNIFIPKMVLTPSDSSIAFKMRRIQFPIIPAFAMTINKSQGQSFDHVAIDLRRNIFSHGQLYVAISRCRSKTNLKIQIPYNSEVFRELKRTGKVLINNVVYEEVLTSRTNTNLFFNSFNWDDFSFSF